LLLIVNGTTTEDLKWKKNKNDIIRIKFHMTAFYIKLENSVYHIAITHLYFGCIWILSIYAVAVCNSYNLRNQHTWRYGLCLGWIRVI